MRRGEFTFNLFLFPGLILFGVFLTLVPASTSQYIWLASILCGIGGIFFVKAKWSRIAEGKWAEFGYRQMNPANKKSYLFGYAMVLIGLIIACF